MILLPLPPKITKKEKNRATFEIEALYPGYGVTIGNTLRRILLSSLEGAAVTQVKIKGVSHEFSTIPGVLEDIILIILNLKQLRFKIFSIEPQKARLKIKGKKEVKGADFELPSQIELINKDAHIASLTSKSAELEMEIQVEKGVGYESVERRKKEKLEIGAIPIDAIFSPVKRVSFDVENMRVGARTDFDRLKIEIETDGTITPKDAFVSACQILEKHLDLFVGVFKKVVPKKEISSKKIVKPEEDFTKMKIDELKLSIRTINSLLKNKIKTVGALLEKSEEEILSLDGMGKQGLKEIKKAFKKLKK